MIYKTSSAKQSFLNMKKIFCIMMALALAGAGCDKQLVEDPRSIISPGDFYTTDQEAILGVNGVYSWLGNSSLLKASLWRALDEGTDVNRSRNQANDPVVMYSLTQFNTGYTGNIWTTLYKAIYNANLVIDKVANAPGISAATKARVTGEAEFLRSIYYYYLIGLYEDAPYYDETNYSLQATQGLARTAAADIRQKLVVSLLDAESKLPAKYSSANDRGRATKGAAETLLVKIYLWQKQWDLAQKKAQQIIDENNYKLMTNYSDVFLDANKFGQEIIFEVEFEPVLNGNDHHTWYQPQKQVGVSPFSGRSWYGNYVPYTTFTNSFEANDKRKAVIIATSYNGTPFKIDPVEKIPAWYGPKFWRLTYPSDTDGGSDVYVFRLADVLLMLAEAANENNDPVKALWAVNQLRPRNGLTAFAAALTQQDMRDYIVAERARELVGEGHRRLDLIRWGKLVSAVKTAAATEEPVVAGNIMDYHVRYPIPAVEIQKDPALVQNTGYF